MENGKILSRSPGLTVVELSGNPHDIGLAHGRLLSPEIALMRARLLRYLSEISLGIGGRFLLWLFGQLAIRMEPFVPDRLRAEMRGIAEGSGQDYRFIFMLNALDDVMVNLACSSFVVMPDRSKTGELVLGRNLDYPLFYETLPSLSTAFFVRPVDGHAFVSLAWPGFSAVVTGMNDAGVCIMDLTSISHDKTTKGTPALLTNRIALQGSATLDEMTESIRYAKRTVGKNLMTASPAGARVLEVSAAGLSEREPSNGLLACTNHFQEPAMAAVQGGTIRPPKSDFPQSYYSYEFSKERLDKILSLTANGKLGTDDVAKVLATEPVANLSTVQSVVFVPGSRRILIARRENTPVSLGEFLELDVRFS